MFSTAFVLIKFLVVFRPMSGVSSLEGTAGRLLSSSGYLKTSSVKNKIMHNDWLDLRHQSLQPVHRGINQI